jgi:hypothetical protein
MISESKEQRTYDKVNKKSVIVSKFVWMWATHLDKCFQLLQTSFGDLKHEEDIRHKSSTEKWHSCKCSVTKCRCAVDIKCNKLKYNASANSYDISVVSHEECSKASQVKQQSCFPKQSKIIIFDLHYNDSSQFKWISQRAYEVHTLWLSTQKTQFLKYPKYSARGLFKKYPTFGREKYIYRPGGLKL